MGWHNFPNKQIMYGYIITALWISISWQNKHTSLNLRLELSSFLRLFFFNKKLNFGNGCGIFVILNLEHSWSVAFFITGLFKKHEILKKEKKTRIKINIPSAVTRARVIITMRKQAPSMTAFILTSKSNGKFIPNISASVKASLTKPDHCFDILPTLVDPSLERTLNSTSPHILNVQKGPSIINTVTPDASFTLNFGLKILHSCWIEPISVPGGAVTSIF